MSTYADIVKRLNAVASQRAKIAANLTTHAAEFTRELDRRWQGGGKITFGAEGDNGAFRQNEIGPPDDNQTCEFLIAIEMEVHLAATVEKFPVVIRETRHGVQIVIPGIGNFHSVDADKPATFLYPINDLRGAVYAWLP
ncbi:hypothetical protein [Paraburkholderia sp. ZP32-5]|uniref:hypothetical protein n=1 Tax=Paraburkholderia sp. ZP32-5 TaxID=2883245 RepID=UPI001F27C42B|nr:hypothetical protein [Paraburkholderia sp. ZP32-5]